MTGRPVLSSRLGWLILVVWQLIVVLMSLGQLLGYAQAVEWGETPTGFRPGSGARCARSNAGCSPSC